MQWIGETTMDRNAGMIAVYTTFPNESDAKNIGAALVGERLAACVNIFPGMVSIYRWNDAIETGQETAMIVKTRKGLEAKVMEFIAAKHPYTVPALIALEPALAAAPYLNWLLDQTAETELGALSPK
jgi:periplasmic divalent cation tolerance protein